MHCKVDLDFAMHFAIAMNDDDNLIKAKAYSMVRGLSVEQILLP